MKATTIQEVILYIAENGDIYHTETIYAKRIDGYFTPTSEAVILELTEDEEYIPIVEFTSKRCPGFDYFLEVFLVKDMLDEVPPNPAFDLNERVEAIIHYAEFDA